MTTRQRSEQVEAAGVLGEAIERLAAKHEVAMNDLAVGIIKATERLTPDQDIGHGLREVARAIDNLAEAVREGNARR